MAKQQRAAGLYVLAGARNHGKSTYVARLLKRRGGNVLVYKEGVNVDDPAYKAEGFKVVKLAEYTGGLAIIDGAELGGGIKGYLLFLQFVNKFFRNGTVVIDDAALYEKNESSDELYQLCIVLRRMGVDLFLVYHGLTFFPIRLTTYINYIILFRTTDAIGGKRNKLPEYEQIVAARQRIDAQVAKGNKYYKEVIKLS